jgi:hypothetical protein
VDPGAGGAGFVIPPFFWVVVATGLFEAGNSLVPPGDQAPVIIYLAGVAGLCIGVAAMWAVTLRLLRRSGTDQSVAITAGTRRYLCYVLRIQKIESACGNYR